MRYLDSEQFKSLCPCQNLQKVVRFRTTFLLYINKNLAINKQVFDKVQMMCHYYSRLVTLDK